MCEAFIYAKKYIKGLEETTLDGVVVLRKQTKTGVPRLLADLVTAGWKRESYDNIRIFTSPNDNSYFFLDIKNEIIASPCRNSNPWARALEVDTTS